MSLARVTNDPALKEQYEDLAIEFAQNAERERDFASPDVESSDARSTYRI
jgi:hypothetical protein